MYEVNGILYAGKPAKMIKVISAKTLPDFHLLLTFSTGEKKRMMCVHCLICLYFSL